MKPHNTYTIYAAGGLVWRDTPEGKQIAVVFREKYQDWSLPKGKMEASDKDLEETALREVREETGMEATITGFAGCINYPVKGKTKLVVFYHMNTMSDIQGSIQEDVQQCQWLAVSEALVQLSHDKEKELLHSSLYMDMKRRNAGDIPLERFGQSSLSGKRLAASITTLREELLHRTKDDKSLDRSHIWRIKLAFQMLNLSEQYLTSGKRSLNQAWKYFHHANQMSLWTLSPGELRSFALSLKTETEKKLSGSWRGRAVENLLSGSETMDRNPPVENIAEATKIRDEHSDNQYHKVVKSRNISSIGK